MASDESLTKILNKLESYRKSANLTADAVEREMLLGPGWIDRFECGLSVPTLDMLLVLLKKYNREPAELFAGVAAEQQAAQIVRAVYAEPDAQDLLIHFGYAKFDATYRLKNASIAEYNEVIKTLRDGLARLTADDDESEGPASAKTDSVVSTFLKAVQTWPAANPSDVWWFIVYRAFFDPFNHPAEFARLDLGQSWKRTGGWALEEVLVRHYGPFLRSKGVDLYIASGPEKRALANQLKVDGRLETDKIDVVLAGLKRRRRIPFGAVHVKASIAERRTDDVPLSAALVKAGYTSPMWTMDCKSTPAKTPMNRGEMGAALRPGEPDRRSAKRKDVEVDGFFSACFSYNRNTIPTPGAQPCDARIYGCDFSNANDLFSQYIVKAWKAFAARNNIA